ncbi:hypothetical protein RND81_14G054100 [Saponaria officinalis]|uniref:G-patch domain-containing protein n=1 Tax=Saponaria officinalis TaxID=3572 RepID=A0AAW1GIU2_SAPOF
MAESSTLNSIKPQQNEEDYMGDLTKFLPTENPNQSKPPKKNPQKSINSSFQPPTKKPKSQINWQEQKRVEKERKQLEEDQKTLENLTSEIPESNIGFKMLKQMGYTPGSGLGKAGRVDPVGVEIRRSRVGIGGEDPAKARLRRERERAEKAREKAVRETRGVEELVEEFGVRQRMQWRVKRVLGSFRKAKDVLDRLENRDVVVVENEDEDDEEEEEEEVITEEDLVEILVKLREEHWYCLFCGCQYESAEALLTNCPGITEDDH